MAFLSEMESPTAGDKEAHGRSLSNTFPNLSEYGRRQLGFAIEIINTLLTFTNLPHTNLLVDCAVNLGYTYITSNFPQMIRVMRVSEENLFASP
jgi:hypothetical protein